MPMWKAAGKPIFVSQGTFIYFAVHPLSQNSTIHKCWNWRYTSLNLPFVNKVIVALANSLPLSWYFASHRNCYHNLYSSTWFRSQDFLFSLIDLLARGNFENKIWPSPTRGYASWCSWFIMNPFKRLVLHFNTRCPGDLHST